MHPEVVVESLEMAPVANTDESRRSGLLVASGSSASKFFRVTIPVGITLNVGNRLSVIWMVFILDFFAHADPRVWEIFVSHGSRPRFRVWVSVVREGGKRPEFSLGREYFLQDRFLYPLTTGTGVWPSSVVRGPRIGHFL